MTWTLRPWRMSDAGALAALLQDGRVRRMLRDGLPYPYTEADARGLSGGDAGIGPGRGVCLCHCPGGYSRGQFGHVPAGKYPPPHGGNWGIICSALPIES